ncbi:hypothetical protein L6R49_12065 [Myxococcota bacterium]|nr:hypothetical protein [Myxococcota bacterium]
MISEREWLLTLCRDARLPEPDADAAARLVVCLEAIDTLSHGPPPPDPRSLRAREDLPLARPCLGGAPAWDEGWLVCRGPALRASG